MTRIGENRSERLDMTPAQFRVVATIRPKYACRGCVGAVTQAAAPAHLIEGVLPTEALLAHVLVAKYADYLPLYRQAQIMPGPSSSLAAACSPPSGGQGRRLLRRPNTGSADDGSARWRSICGRLSTAWPRR